MKGSGTLLQGTYQQCFCVCICCWVPIEAVTRDGPNMQMTRIRSHGAKRICKIEARIHDILPSVWLQMARIDGALWKLWERQQITKT